MRGLAAEPSAADRFEQTVLADADSAYARVMAGVEDEVERLPPGLEPADAVRWVGDRVTELLASLAELPLEHLIGLTTRDDHEGEQPSGGRHLRGEPLVLSAVPGSVAEARVWVHTVGEVSTGTLSFALGQLVAPDGSPWPETEVRFTPGRLALPAPAESSTLLRLRIPTDASIGEHHGLIIGRGVAGALVPITVVVG